MIKAKKIYEKFEKLLSEGKSILDNCGWSRNRFGRTPSELDYFRFRTESLNLVKRVCGEQSVHYKELKSLVENKDTSTAYSFPLYYGILQAAYNDFNEEFLFDVYSLISAEILGDFLEQCEVLLAQNYTVPAASLAGAVLEDSLRKLCKKHNIDIPDKTKIDKLNISLAKANVYNKLTQKEITAKADIRNNADHGHYDKFNKDDVADMIKFIKRFEIEYLTR